MTRNNIKYWIISANHKKYDHKSAFKEWGFIDWKQGNYTFKVGDIVYVYTTSPIQSIEYKTRVERINLSDSQRIDDKKYWSDLAMYEESKDGFFIRLKLLETFDESNLHLDLLMEYGLASAPQGPQKLKEDLISYIKTFEDDLSFDDVYRKVLEFNQIRGWESFQSADGFAKSISIEAAELLECFQWNNYYDLEHVSEELADVMIYCLLMTDYLDLDIKEIILDKIKKNGIKYPVSTKS